MFCLTKSPFVFTKVTHKCYAFELLDKWSQKRVKWPFFDDKKRGICLKPRPRAPRLLKQNKVYQSQLQ